MATRLYFPTTTAAAVTPNQDAAWQYTSELLRRRLAQESNGTSAITIGTQIGPWTVGQRALDRQYVSDPLSAQTISGTVKGQLMVREYATGDDATQIILGIRVVSRDGGTVRATLLSVGSYVTGAEFISNVTHRNKSIANGDAISSYTCVTGDRLVVEIGYLDAGTGATPESSAKWGENATDLPENETQTTDGAGWLELSATLTFETLVDPNPVAATASLPSPNVGISASPSAVSATATVPSPVAGLTALPGAATATSSVPDPTVEAAAGANADPNPVTSTASVPGPTIGITASPGAAASTASLPSPTAGLVVAPAAISSGASVPSPLAGLTAAPSAITSTASVPSPVAGLVAQPGEVAAASSVPAVTVEAAIIVLVGELLSWASVPVPAVDDASGPEITEPWRRYVEDWRQAYWAKRGTVGPDEDLEPYTTYIREWAVRRWRTRAGGE